MDAHGGDLMQRPITPLSAAAMESLALEVAPLGACGLSIFANYSTASGTAAKC